MSKDPIFVHISCEAMMLVCVTARLKSGYSLTGSQGYQVPIIQLVQVPRRMVVAPAVAEEVRYLLNSVPQCNVLFGNSHT